MRASLSLRLLLLAIVPALAVALAAALAGSYGVQRALGTQAADAASRAAELAEQEGARLTRAMGAQAAALAVREDLLAAMAAGERDRLAALLVPVFAASRAADPRLRVLELTDAAGRVVLRAHNPSRHGDDKARVPDVALALRGQDALGGVVSPATGEMAIGATVPLRQGGRIIGTLKAAGYLDAATAAQIARATGGEIVLIGAGRLRETTIAGLEIAALPEATRAAIEAARTGVAPGTVAGLRYSIAQRPLLDLAGAPTGAVVVLLPMSSFEAVAWEAMGWIGGSALLLLLLAGAIGARAAQRLAAPLRGLAGAMQALAAGQQVAQVPGSGRADEIGRMAAAVSVFRTAIDERARLEAAAADEQAERDRRQAARDAATRDFMASVGTILDTLGASAGRMRQAADAMAEAAARTREGTAASSASAALSARGLDAVAAAGGQLSASVGEITRRVAEAASATGAAVERAGATDTTVRGLSEAAAQIGEVVRLIADIAGRTNLLALNATIEAARAGDAGKGFAVVASEVKQLAAQTARATEDIGRQVAGIRAVTEQAVGAIAEVGGAIERVSSASTAIAAAVEQQGAATTHIAGQVRAVAEQSSAATAQLSEVAQGAERAGAAGEAVLATAGEVARVCDDLRAEVDRFLAAIGMQTSPDQPLRRAA
ncbi:methyl-accepting chemotaxis protein [Roseomonas sp. CECT 9278]|uniref:methyl-accepting chemotaxis protein n=1 Tax=Roseomonas sp. CECT 9278 TaxID=2845823 RepID=UPI001E50F480|nr:methyl-accepting chemotaxis protein [Roseomonas sp. CECT 9278]CAH0184600.1 hypothetical protein ROS9278_01529 [Roseomonas sp. CECT 9278]